MRCAAARGSQCDILPFKLDGAESSVSPAFLRSEATDPYDDSCRFDMALEHFTCYQVVKDGKFYNAIPLRDRWKSPRHALAGAADAVRIRRDLNAFHFFLEDGFA